MCCHPWPDVSSVQKHECLMKERRGSVECQQHCSGMKTPERIWPNWECGNRENIKWPRTEPCGTPICMEQIRSPFISPDMSKLEANHLPCWATDSKTEIPGWTGKPVEFQCQRLLREEGEEGQGMLDREKKICNGDCVDQMHLLPAILV